MSPISEVPRELANHPEAQNKPGTVMNKKGGVESVG